MSTTSVMPTPILGDVDAALRYAERAPGPQIIQVGGPGGPTYLLHGERMRATDVSEALSQREVGPLRMTGTTHLRTPDSFAAWVARQANGATCVYADNDLNSPSFTAIIDHAGERPADEHNTAWQRYRGKFPLVYSRTWKVWQQANEKYVSQGDFAAFIEDRFGDLIGPPDAAILAADEALRATLAAVGAKSFADPLQMLEVARGLEMRSDTRVKSKTNLSTGETQLAFETSVSAPDGELRVPQAFLIALPVFENAAPFRVPVRLRVRAQGGGIQFAPFIHRLDLVLDAAFTEIVAAVKGKVDALRKDEPPMPFFVGVAPSEA